ncbi:hypothetical protein B296_00042839 [Ensete ventricosum]|uniref:Dynamin stalk domain-containing protein n=1 Tax=Ensete ventricosum TaxID=4639 RepID=A0A426YPH5_ENSVE|nr:hypothetical protein B296_00042839 [Ensete ventricosum]
MTTMESLIGLVNRIQRACTVLGDHGGADGALPTLWEALPSVAVVGGQVQGTEVTAGLSEAANQSTACPLGSRRPGGDRIYGVFDNQLPVALKKLPFDRHLSLQNVKKVVSEADGYQPHLIAPEQGYRRLIESSLNYFRGPAEASVDAVHFVLKELVRKSIGETQELKRFPTLQAELAAASYQALEKFREDSRKTVIRLVDMEASYLTVDFFRKLPQEVEKAGNPATPTIDRYTDGHFRRIASNVSSYIFMVSETLKNSIPKAAVYCQVREAKRSLLNHFYTQVGKKEVFYSGHMYVELFMFYPFSELRTPRLFSPIFKHISLEAGKAAFSAVG